MPQARPPFDSVQQNQIGSDSTTRAGHNGDVGAPRLALERPEHMPRIWSQILIQVLGIAWGILAIIQYIAHDMTANPEALGSGISYVSNVPALVIGGHIFGMILTVILWRRYQYMPWLPLAALLADTVSQNPVVLSTCLFVIATQGLSRYLLLAVCFGLTSTIVNILVESKDMTSTTITVLVYIGAWIGLGLYTGARRDLITSLKDRAVRAETTQFAQAAQARTMERARIAREMHDIVAHKISLIAMHAGGLEVQSNTSPDRVQASASLIRETASQALQELRGVLGVLRQSDGAQLSPQATWDDVLALIEDTRSTGIKVDFQNDILTEHQLPSLLPGSLSRTVYRILQESMTNVHKHATHTQVTVIFSGAPGLNMLVEIKNPLPVGQVSTLPGAGMGLLGIRERVELSNGNLTAGTKDGMFMVRASIPWIED